MSGTHRNWTGDEWQEEAIRLLRYRHSLRSESFQTVYDRHGGDLGIEAFSRAGHAYQCYAVEEPVTTLQRYEKQRNKMTEDIGKFIRNAPQLSRLFEDFPIRRWCLVVPFYDSANLNLHASTKQSEVRGAGLPYVTDDFAIDIIDERDLQVEKAGLLRQGLGQLDVTVPEPAAPAVSDWASANDTLVQRLDAKIGRMRGLSDSDRTTLRDEILRYHVRGQNVRKRLREAYLPLLESVDKAKHEKEAYLLGQSLLIKDEPSDIIEQTRQDYLSRLAWEVGALTAGTREALAWEAIADWLLRCPLNFREPLP